MPYPGMNKNKRSSDTYTQQASKYEVDTVGKTETFFSRNVKLLTFIICMAVILSLMAAFGIWRMLNQESMKEPENRMTVLQMEDLVALGSALTWADFEGYDHDVVAEKYAYVCRYDVKGGDYYLMVSSPAEGEPITSILWVDVDNNTEQEIYDP